ncbi:hypothetical protein COCVIDRAFT_87040, partial [Bipolaris victoriae FI3]
IERHEHRAARIWKTMTGSRCSAETARAGCDSSATMIYLMALWSLAEVSTSK